MKSNIGFCLPRCVAATRHRLVRSTLLALCAFSVALVNSQAQTITSAVPGFITYQGKVSNANGTLVGAGTPVNRTVIFRIWGHQSNSTVNDLVYSEQQTVTISEGEFSVLIGQGSVVSGTPLGYSESAKGPPTITVGSAAVFGGATRYLGVTIDDPATAADPEVSPRQQLVTSAYAFRAKYAESVGTNGVNTLTTLDSGNVGIGSTNPGAKLEVNGNIRAGGAGTPTTTLSLLANSATTQAMSIGYSSSIGTYSSDAAAGDTVIRTENGGKLLLQTGTGASAIAVGANNSVGIGVGTPGTSGSAWANARLGVDGNISLRGAAGGNSWTNQRLLFGGDGSGFALHFGSIDNAGTLSSRMLSFYDSGRLAMGTTNPIARLGYSTGWRGFDFIPSASAVGILEGSDLSRLHLRNAAGAVNLSQDFVIDNGGNAVTMQWLGGGLAGRGSILTMSQAGNVGIGTSSPDAKLDVRGGIKVGGDSASGYTFNSGDTDGGMFSPADGFITLWTNNVERIRFDPFGNVSIGTTNMGQAKLVVSGTGSDSVLSHSSFGSNSTALGYNTGSFTFGDVSIKANAVIHGGAFRAVSDARIKRIQGRSNGVADLALLNQIEITDYTYIDAVSHGSRSNKKLIGQQVESIFPQAVTRTTDVVPDIYKPAPAKDGWIELPTDLKAGERVRLIADKKPGIYDVLEVQPNRFRTNYTETTAQLIVYGREVKDFRVVDYEAVAMLNVSATQEINREVVALRSANAELTQRIAELEAKNQTRDAKLAAIEKLLSSSQTVMARPAAAPRSNANGQE